MIVLLDTCVVLDALLHREPFNKEAETLFLLAANHQIDGCITAKSATDIYYLTHRNTHSDEVSRKILANLFTLFGVLDSYGLDCQKALISAMSDYEDAVMVETAKRTGMQCIITRNSKDYSKSTVPVYTPADFLKLIEAQASED